MRTFSKFLVLLWKNLLLKRRHWFMTILEIAVPVLLFVILAVIRGQIDQPLYAELITKNLETYEVCTGLTLKKWLWLIITINFLEVYYISKANFNRRTIWFLKCLWIDVYAKMEQNRGPQMFSFVVSPRSNIRQTSKDKNQKSQV